MEITKKVIEDLIGQKVQNYEIETAYYEDGVLRLNITVTPKTSVEKIKITIKPNKSKQV